jgi:hypothetical protein
VFWVLDCGGGIFIESTCEYVSVNVREITILCSNTIPGKKEGSEPEIVTVGERGSCTSSEHDPWVSGIRTVSGIDLFSSYVDGLDWVDFELSKGFFFIACRLVESLIFFCSTATGSYATKFADAGEKDIGGAVKSVKLILTRR